MTSGIETFVGAMVALAVYGVGKTFFWPTMLAVVGDRFPRTGAVAMSIMGGIGMMSAGLLRRSRPWDTRRTASPPSICRPPLRPFTSSTRPPVPSKFVFLDEVRGLDGTKLSEPRPQRQEPGAADRRDASIVGDRETLKAGPFIPAAMAAIYLLLFLYFKAIGGYRPVHIDEAVFAK